MSHSVLIFGGGIAGLTAALSLATKGHSVTVIEQAAQLGRRLWHAPPPVLLEAHAHDRIARFSTTEVLPQPGYVMHEGQRVELTRKALDKAVKDKREAWRKEGRDATYRYTFLDLVRSGTGR